MYMCQPWCPHCQEFRWHYIDFARNCTDLASRVYGIDIEFHAISCTANSRICRKQHISSYPTIRLYPSGSSNFTKVDFWSIHCFTLLQTFSDSNVDMEALLLKEEEDQRKQHEESMVLSSSKHDNDDYDNKSKLRPLKKKKKKKSSGTNNSDDDTAVILKPRHDSRTKTIILDDAFLSFDFAMRQSIFTKIGPLTNETSVVFDEWIELLKLVLPPFWSIHKALDAITSNMENVVQDEENLIEIMDQYGPSSKKTSWRGCTSTSSHGYTCGLWELFHIITVSVVEWNIAAITPDSIVETDDVANQLYSYVSEFFGCDVCRRNFMMNYDACSQDRCHRLGSSTTNVNEWKQLVLWLWEEHNSVNVRLQLEKKQREYKEKHRHDKQKEHREEVALTKYEIQNAQWPSRYDCPSCWYDDGTWDDDLIYKYLRLKYWPVSNDETAMQYSRELQIANAEKKILLQEIKREEAEEEDDDDIIYREEKNMYIVLGIPVLGVFTIAFLSIKKQMELDRTGRHKKSDSIL